MTRPPIQMTYFDLGMVLLRFDHGRCCSHLSSLFDVTFDDAHQALFESGLQHSYESGEISTKEFCDALCNRFGKQASEADIRVAVSDIFWMNHPTVAVASQLRAAGHRTGILSNTCEAHWEFVTDGRFKFLNEYFDEIVLSYEAKSMKPDANIYQVAIEKSGVAAEEIFFMDDRQENVEGALAAGIDAVHFTHGHRLAKQLSARGLRFNF